MKCCLFKKHAIPPVFFIISHLFIPSSNSFNPPNQSPPYSSNISKAVLTTLPIIMKAFAILASLLSVAAAVNPLLHRDACACDISKCPASGDKVRHTLQISLSYTNNQQRCDCVVGLMDACYVAQTHAGVDCGKPVYPVRLVHAFSSKHHTKTYLGWLQGWRDPHPRYGLRWHYWWHLRLR